MHKPFPYIDCWDGFIFSIKISWDTVHKSLGFSDDLNRIDFWKANCQIRRMSIIKILGLCCQIDVRKIISIVHEGVWTLAVFFKKKKNSLWIWRLIWLWQWKKFYIHISLCNFASDNSCDWTLFKVSWKFVCLLL